ncbi:MAG: DNA topoisomerase IV subunit A [Bdellovibrionales bacterium]|nr:DNA topoisomerase IV subunit A [Bdellovibrionales bacterium]
MAILDVELAEESQKRYLTYALSVVSSRALPDVRDGLKPVQRRILYAMINNLHLGPDKHHRKSAAVVGEVLARYHPHGDSACYEAMVRMAQDFSLRYPLVDGQGNFGSLDGDSAAAYRYTEARLTAFALEVIGDIGQETVSERDNFDQTVKEPVVLPSRVPNLLVNGASGIAVGMATAIPPHNLGEIIKGLLKLIEDETTSDAKLLTVIKGPDFPTGCLILNTRDELREIYSSGRGAIRMRAGYVQEEVSGRSTRNRIIINSIPYGVDKSQLIEKIADIIIARKVPQLDDVRDESTTEVRIVLETTPGADVEAAMAYLFKNTPLQQNFNVNLTALVPTQNPFVGRPALLSLRDCLLHFVEFRVQVTRCKLEFEKNKLEERIHLLEGLEKLLDVLDEVIEIVRKSSGRSDAAAKLVKRFKLSEKQAFFVVDLRIYQLSRTSVEEVTSELAEKRTRVDEILKILKSEKALKGEVARDLERISTEYGDARRCQVIGDFDEPEYDKEAFVEHEDVWAIVTKDGWMKRLRATNDPQATRVREGDALYFAGQASTRDTLVLITNKGNVFGTQILDLAATSGYGEPVQKMFRFGDGEQIVKCLILPKDGAKGELLVYTRAGYGFRFDVGQLGLTKKTGKRLVRLGDGDDVIGTCPVDRQLLVLVSTEGYCTCFLANEVPQLAGGGKGVILQKMSGEDTLAGAISIGKKGKVTVALSKGNPKEIDVGSMTIGSRAKRGLKLIKRGGPVVGVIPETPKDGSPKNLTLF